MKTFDPWPVFFKREWKRNWPFLAGFAITGFLIVKLTAGFTEEDLKNSKFVQEHKRAPPTRPPAPPRLVVFGGSGEGEGNYLNDVHVLDVGTMTWTSPEVKGDVPAPRDSHGAVAVGSRLFVYGGDCGDRYHGEVDVLDMDSMAWSRFAVKGASPGVRAGHAAVGVGSKVYVIGGVGDKQYYSDAWILDVANRSWTRLEVCGQQPQGRFSHTAVVMNTDIAIYGGCGEDERPLNELLILQLGSEHPNGRYNISMCKILSSHWSQEKRKFLRAENQKDASMGNRELGQKPREAEIEQRNPFLCGLENGHVKRRKTTDVRPNEAESEQEEHSLNLNRTSGLPVHLLLEQRFMGQLMDFLIINVQDIMRSVDGKLHGILDWIFPL